MSESSNTDAGKVVPLDSVREAFAAGKPRAAKPADDKGRDSGGDGGPPMGDDTAGAGSWRDLVQPLGVRGDRYYLLDPMQQLREKKESEFGRLGIIGLFGSKNHRLEGFWPKKYGPSGDPQGCDYDKAAKEIMAATAQQGIWDPFGRTRGAGSWADSEGRLVLHCGDAIWKDGEYSDPGLHDGFVYPADKKFVRPWSQKVVGGERGPGRILLDTLRTWNWKRGETDARLLVGWIGAAMLAGAIDWRPVVWMTGGRGTGKSTLQRLLSLLFDGALIAVSDATAAGVWQKLGHSTLPVTLDEVEAEEDNRRGQGLIKFARQAASGGLVLRGGSDHGASEFNARSCFALSSILIPPLSPQDRSRIAILELGELGGEAPPDLDPRKYRELGQRLLRRLSDGWERWPMTLAMYRDALARANHNGRGADVFGTLLAAADLLLDDGDPHSDAVSALAEELNVKGLAEAEDDAPEEERCLQHLLCQIIPLGGAIERRSVAEWCARAVGYLPHEDDEAGGATKFTKRAAQRMLCQYGLKVQDEADGQKFAVASDHAEMRKLFLNTHWAGRSGGTGVWTQALRRHRSACPSGKTVWFGEVSGKATFLPITSVLTNPNPGDGPASVRGRLDNWRGDQ